MKFRVTRPVMGYPDLDTVIEVIGFVDHNTLHAVYIDEDRYIQTIPVSLLRADPVAFVPSDC